MSSQGNAYTMIVLAAAAAAVFGANYTVKVMEPCVHVRSTDLKNACKFGGLQLTSVGGTLLYASNCNVLLPKQTFRKRPAVLFGYANRVSIDI